MADIGEHFVKKKTLHFYLINYLSSATVTGVGLLDEKHQIWWFTKIILYLRNMILLYIFVVSIIYC